MRLGKEEEEDCSSEMGLRGKSCGHLKSVAIEKPEVAKSVMILVCERVDILGSNSASR